MTWNLMCWRIFLELRAFVPCPQCWCGLVREGDINCSCIHRCTPDGHLFQIVLAFSSASVPASVHATHRMPTNSKFDAWGFTWAKFVVTIQLETTFIRKKRLNIIKQSCILFPPKWPQMSFLAMWKLFPGHFYVWESASKWLFNVLVNLSVRSSCCITHEI